MTHPDPLPRSTPAEQGLDAAAIAAFVDGLESTPGIEPHSLMLLRHGHLVAEGWWHPYTADRVHLLYSLSKSFTAAAAGFAVAEGLIDLDATVLSYLPEIDADITDPRSRAILVRHVLAMASGHRVETIDRATALDPLDLVRGFLLLPPDEEPGSVFAYNQSCTFAVSAIVQRVSGLSLTGFLQPRLFDPLGIGETGWILDLSGREIGYSGLHATTDAIARLGQLYLDGGVWNGQRLLPAAWVAEAGRRHIGTDLEGNPDWRQGYGFQFWMGRHGYRGDGAYGQYCVILPEQDLVLAVTSQTPDMQPLLDLVWEHLLPAASPVPGVAGPADDELAQRLSTLRLPPAPGGPAPAGAVGAEFTAVAGNDQPGLETVQLTRGDNGTWTIGLVEGESRIEATLGVGEWAVTDVVAVSGGWTPGDSAVRVDVAFIETPHRLHLVCRSDGMFECRWETTPLHSSPLNGLRKPVRVAV